MADNDMSHTENFLKGLWKENPVFVSLLGMCPTLAVSNSLINSLSMGLATAFVLVMSSALISLVRNLIPKEVRMASYIMIIATFVTVAEYILQAVSIEVHKSLGAFVPLIVVNCNILGRAEAFASKNKLVPSIIDAAGVGLGFTFAIGAMGFIREIIGNGSLAGISLFGPNYEPWIVMVLPGGGFFILGLLLLLFNWISQRKKKGNV